MSELPEPAFAGHVTVTAAEASDVEVAVYVELTLPDGDGDGVVQLLAAGGRGNHHYWTCPDPSGPSRRYSYVDAATRAGFAICSIDSVGRGNSDRPDSA